MIRRGAAPGRLSRRTSDRVLEASATARRSAAARRAATSAAWLLALAESRCMVVGSSGSGAGSGRVAGLAGEAGEEPAPATEAPDGEGASGLLVEQPAQRGGSHRLLG